MTYLLGGKSERADRECILWLGRRTVEQRIGQHARVEQAETTRHPL